MQQSKISTTQFVKLLNFTLKHNYISTGNSALQQRIGVGQGTVYSSIAVNLSLSQFEKDTIFR